MTQFTDILTGRINLKRNTSFLVDKTAVVVNPSADRQPPKSCRMEVVIDGATVGGSATILISGNVDETLNFTANGKQIGESNFTSISGITVTNISEGFISIRCLNKMGQPINQEKTVKDNMSIRFYAQDGRIRMMKTGQEQISKYKIMAASDEDIQDNDLIYAVSGVFGLTLGKVTFSEKIYDFDGVTHHTEAEVMDL